MTSSVRPTNVARVTMLMQSDLLMSNLNSTTVDLLKVQNQMSTGLKLSRPSDNPTDATTIMHLDSLLERYEQYLTNINHADVSLSTADSALSQVSTQMTKVKELASSGIGATDTERQSNASDLMGIIESLVNIGNTTSPTTGTYIFGGQNGNTAPFTQPTDGGVMFNGSQLMMQTRTDADNLFDVSVDANAVFGAMSSQVVGIADLDPDITADTLLSDLNGALGEGVRLGSILVNDGSSSETIDLSDCVTVGDVISKLDASSVINTVGISADGTSLTVTSGAATNLTITEVGTGTTARDLGIYDNTGGDAIVLGQDVDARLTSATPVTALAGGAGIDLTSGLLITNSLINSGNPSAIDLSSAQTMEDILNAINNAGLGARAEINEAGTGINVFNQLSGSEMSIGENGGTTAEDLGIRSMTGTTLLSELNGGKGIHPRSGADDILITDKNGATYAVNLDTATTIQDVIDLINAATGGPLTVEASLASTGNGIVLTDNTGGMGDFSVERISNDGDDNGYFITEELGWDRDKETAAGNVITGDNVNPVEPDGLFSHLMELYDAFLISDDDQANQAITAAATKIDQDMDRLNTVHGKVSANVRTIEQRQERIEDNVLSVKSLRSDLQDVDFTEAVTRYQNLYTALQANLMTSTQLNTMSLLDFLT